MQADSARSFDVAVVSLKPCAVQPAFLTALLMKGLS